VSSLRWCVVAVGLGLLAGAGRAVAQPLEVTPTLVELSQDARAVLVTLRNASAEPVRYQVAVFAWDQDVRGEMKLAPTTDLQFFPSVLSIAPGEKRNLRVAASVPAGAAERSYRLFVEQLPDAARAANAVRVLTRVGIPVFVEPATRVVRAEATALVLSGRRFTFTLRNTGNVRIRPDLVRAVGRDAAGTILFDEKLPAWYVLAGGERSYDVAVPEAACAGVRTLTAEIAVAKGAVEGKLAVPQGACGP
jgi:fimbrial chaperone protein